MNHKYYGWVAEQPKPEWSEVDLYGWGAQAVRSVEAMLPHAVTEACAACGAEFSVQRTGAMYECEKCMNLGE